MMKRILIKLIKLYQAMPFRFHQYCRYIPSCSNYAILAIERFGVMKGLLLSIKRILKCNPFCKGGIDLVPEKEVIKEK